MRLYRTERGIARGDGDQLLLLDLPYRDVGELLADDPALARRARVTASLPVGATALLAPLRRPKRVVVVGANYVEHVAEAGMAIPTTPAFSRSRPEPIFWSDHEARAVRRLGLGDAPRPHHSRPDGW